MNTETRSLSAPTLRRLPLYLHRLRQIRDDGRESVSCTHLGKDLRLDPTQVRKDLEAAGAVGRPKVGHSVGELISVIEDFLGWSNVNQAFLIGAGNLGAALMGYARFKESGLDILAGFDSDPAKVGKAINGKPVYAMQKFAGLVKRMHVMVGILAVPANSAQVCAELMHQAGIRAIWNFSPVRLQLPDEVIVQNEDLYSGLATLTQQLAAQMRLKSAKKS